MKEVSSIYSYFSSSIISANSKSVSMDDFRLNAEYYEEKDLVPIKSQIKFIPLSSLASVVFPGIFKRILTEDRKHGIKFLTTSDMMMLEPESDKYLSSQLTTNLSIYRVSENTLLVSRSGTIGNTIYVDARIKDFALTEDALRVTPFKSEDMGLLYFYFTSEFGNNAITGKKSGAVIDHIYEEDLLKLQIPKLDQKIIKRLNDFYLKVKSNREEAHKLIANARTLVLKYNSLTPLSNPVIENGTSWESEIVSTNISEFTEGFRLDAHFYNPIAKKCVNDIVNNTRKYKTLKELTNDIVIGKRFKRNYVESDHGTPFIGSKNILQIRPAELKYLSNSEIDFMDDLILKKHMILIACSGSLGGTFGRTCFVYNNFEKYAASQHILRVIPNRDLIDPGYLYAFLSSEYGYTEITRYRWGALIDEIDDEDMEKILIPLPTDKQQLQIGDLIRTAYDLRSEALELENKAQKLLTETLT
jgi:type I restriction enzyme S subunit